MLKRHEIMKASYLKNLKFTEVIMSQEKIKQFEENLPQYPDIPTSS